MNALRMLICHHGKVFDWHGKHPLYCVRDGSKGVLYFGQIKRTFLWQAVIISKEKIPGLKSSFEHGLLCGLGS